MRFEQSLLAMALAAAIGLSGCGGGSSAPTTGTAPSPQPVACTGSCVTADSKLLVSDVEQIVAQAAAEAQARSAPATIAVVDRVGNVLTVFKMRGSRDAVTISGGRGVVGGLEGLRVIPAAAAAIAKAVTGAYLSSEGNAFTTRTASQIVQQHFNVGEGNQPSGPLFGVQFSQLPCSDLSNRFSGAIDFGPKRSPLGLSADPGGFPLYKNGVPVGGIGIAADDTYGLDLNIQDFDQNLDELIAIAGTFGYAAPNDRRGDRITADGKTFRFSDVGFNDLQSQPTTARYSATNPALGTPIAVTGYATATVREGTAFGQPASGIRPDTLDYPGLDAFVLVDQNNVERYRPRAGTDGTGALTAIEVREVLRQALGIANRARAQIRQPLDSQARVSISVVDSAGAILGVVRTRDAPIFGTDVSLQKARAANFFSNRNAAAELTAAPNAAYPSADASAVLRSIPLGSYVAQMRSVLAQPTSLGDGAFAYSNRGVGNLARPFLPDGIIGTPPGPLSKPFAEWSPFTVGVQLDLVLNRLAGHVLFVAGAAPADVPQNCTTVNRIANGIQIFPGSVPIYRGSQLIGAVGVSGDGIDQDDMISFLGLHNAGVALSGAIGNAPAAVRSDQVVVPGVGRLRYVQCPQAPFLNSTDQSVCEGK
jgi:uncharacterized protein GlcG (DUF336 family)